MTIQLPPAFIEKMQNILGNEFNAFYESFKIAAPVSVRINPEKNITHFNHDEHIPWCTNGYYLKERPSFTFDPLFHAGCYYVQEASSMFLEQVYRKINPENKTVRVLDLCAAPGGKSTHLLNLLSKDSLLVSNEIIASRNTVLQQNLIKWGYSNVIITQNQPSDFTRFTDFFDIILVDAPCSGEGLFRKDKHAISEWSLDNIERCVNRQELILKDILPALKPGGHIIYSTCTYEPSENDLQIESLIKKNKVESVNLADIGFGATHTSYGLQCYPHKVKGEGYYIAAVKKVEEESSTLSLKNSFKPAVQYRKMIEDYLEEPELFEPLLVNDTLFAIPKLMVDVYDFIASKLYIRQAGVCIGSIKGKDLIPSHDLALSLSLRNDILSLPLTEDDAIRYLKCESIPPNYSETGWYTANFESFPLGWVKVLSSRVNNYFPRNWRILKDHAEKTI